MMLRLHPDTRILRLEEIPEELAHEFESGDAAYVLSLEQSRSNAQVVDERAAHFLERFRQPSQVAEAIVDLGLRFGEDPQYLLDTIYPAVRAWMRAGVLLEPDATPEPAASLLRTGATFEGMEVVETLRALTDTEVYRAVSESGRSVVVKIIPDRGADGSLECLIHEAEILARMNASGVPHVPELVSASVDSEQPWIVLDDVGEHTADKVLYDESTELELRCALLWKVLGVVADLHEHGFLHGDINPGNMVVGGSDRVTLVDFGGTVATGTPAQANRIGVPIYYEPEFAATALENEIPPTASVAGEIYSLANICYRAITGHAPVRLGLQQQVSLLQIANNDVRPFNEFGLHWPAVEAVLRAALSRDPSARPESVRALLEALRNAVARGGPRVAANPGGPSAATPGPDADDVRLRALVVQQLHRRVVDPEAVARLDDACRKQPDVYAGVAGLALAALTYAESEGDADALAMASVWVSGARQALAHPADRTDDGPISRYSVIQAEPGLDLVEAMIASSGCDLHGAAAPIARFVHHIDECVRLRAPELEPDETRLDLANGPPGLLVGAAMLAARGDSSRPSLDLGPLVTAADELFEMILDEAEPLPLADGLAPLGYLGVAHGSMGVLYALLRWQRERQRPSVRLATLVRSFATALDCAVPSVSGPGRRRGMRHHGARVLPGWCHGAAGHAIFWAAAAEALEADDHIDRAVTAASSIVEHPASRHGSLCCGLAGQTVALRRVAQLTGEKAWSDAAEDFGYRAAIAAADLGESGLFKGTAGAVMAVFSTDPRSSLL